MVRTFLILVVILAAIGCSAPEGGDGGKETASVEAKAKVNASMSQENQDMLAAKVKAWDPKKDKK